MSGFGGRSTADIFGPNGGEPSPEWHDHLTQVLEETEQPPNLWGEVADPRDAPGFESASAGRLSPETSPDSTRPDVRVTRLADVQPQATSWLWPGRLPKGKLVVLDGDPGLGKSTLALDLAARVSIGASMPDGPSTTGPANVVVLSAEDGLADTIRPRLDAAGADTGRIVSLTINENDAERGLASPSDLAQLERAVRCEQAALVVLDPLVAHLDGGVNSFRDQDVRRALGPLASIAEATGAAILAIRHLTKLAGGSPLYRGGGSIGITGAARSVWLVAADPDDEARRILAIAKSNLAPIPPALAYRIEPAALGGISTSRIVWEGFAPHTAASLLAVPSTDGEHSALDDAKAFLRETLAHGPVPVKAVQKQAREAGISERTLDRAKSAAGVRSMRPDGFTGPWYWEQRESVPRQLASYDAKSGNGDVRRSSAEYPTSPGRDKLVDLPVEADYPLSAFDGVDDPDAEAER